LPENNATCFGCLKTRVLTREHILPQAIGGKLKAKIYCKGCNDTFGHQLDDEISRCFGHFATILGIRRERGSNQPFKVQEIKSGTNLLSDGKSLRRKDPLVEYQIDDDGRTLKSANVVARTEDEVRKIIESLGNKYRLKHKPEPFFEYHPGPTETKNDFVFDTGVLRRSVAKVAYSFLCYKLLDSMVLSSAFDEVRAYIVNGATTDLSSPNFVHTAFMTDYCRPLHKVYVRLDRQKDMVVGYVMFFGTFRYTILLSKTSRSTFEWPCLDYTIDPVTSRVIGGNPNFRAPSIDQNDILKPRQSLQFVREEIYKGHKMLETYVEGYEISRVEAEK